MSDRLVTLQMVMAAVEAASGLTRREILAERRGPDQVHARLAAYWLASKMTLQSMTAIGRFMQRDHSTVISGIERADSLRAADAAFRAATDALLETLLALEQAGHLRLAAAADPLATARRVLARPEREAVRVSTAEIIAMAEEIVAIHGPDAPVPNPFTMEIDHAA